MIKLDVEEKIVNSVRFLIQKEKTDKMLASGKYLEEIKQGLSPDRTQLLIDIIKERLYRALEEKVKDIEE